MQGVEFTRILNFSMALVDCVRDFIVYNKKEYTHGFKKRKNGETIVTSNHGKIRCCVLEEPGNVFISDEEEKKERERDILLNRGFNVMSFPAICI